MSTAAVAAEPSPWRTLRTARLVLRAFAPGDAAAFAAYRSDDDVARYQGWSTPFTLESARAFIDEQQRGAATVGAGGQWTQVALERQRDGALVGDVAFRPRADDRRIVDVGVTLARDAHGCGYASEAVRALFAHLFEVRGAHRIVAEVDARNAPSARLMQRVGMRREAHHVEAEWFRGAWCDLLVFALLRREWADGGAAAQQSTQ